METHDACMRLLGLALRGGNLVLGSDAVQSAAHAGTARLLMLSADASPHICRDAQTWAERGHCMLIALPFGKEELGGALGRGNVAVAALTDTGLAAAVGERLARLDPARYTDTAERLKRKVERAGERRTARPRARPGKSVGTARKPGAVRDSAKQSPGSVRETGKHSAAAGYPVNRKSAVKDSKSGAAQRKPAARDTVKRGAGKQKTDTMKQNPPKGKSSAAARPPSTRRKNTDT